MAEGHAGREGGDQERAALQKRPAGSAGFLAFSRSQNPGMYTFLYPKTLLSETPHLGFAVSGSDSEKQLGV